MLHFKQEAVFFIFFLASLAQICGQQHAAIDLQFKILLFQECGRAADPLPFSRNSNDDARCIDLLNNKTTSLPHTFN